MKKVTKIEHKVFQSTEDKRNWLREKLNSNKKIFHIQFVKKDGNIRDMCARLGVVKYLRGGIDSTAHMPQYINVYEMVMGKNESNYRKVNLDTVLSLKVSGIEYIFDIKNERATA